MEVNVVFEGVLLEGDDLSFLGYLVEYKQGLDELRVLVVSSDAAVPLFLLELALVSKGKGNWFRKSF